MYAYHDVEVTDPCAFGANRIDESREFGIIPAVMLLSADLKPSTRIFTLNFLLFEKKCTTS
jgi:hypothetical protein